MADDSLGALYKALQTRLNSSGDVWGTRVYADVAPAGTARPYVVYAMAAGGEINTRIKQDAEYVIMVRSITESAAQAFSAAARISALLNDADYGSALQLSGGADWYILHTLQEQNIYRVELVDGTWVYHSGYRFRIRMEATANA